MWEIVNWKPMIAVHHALVIVLLIQGYPATREVHWFEKKKIPVINCFIGFTNVF
jgi:hypothetical protein